MFFAFHQSAQIAIKSLLAKKGRSFLTMLGVIIGVAAVIMIISLGAGAQSLILNQVESLGSNIVGIMPGASDDNGPPSSVMGIVITTLNYEDLQALTDKKNVPNLLDAVAFSKGVGSIVWQSNSYDTNISGVTERFLAVEGGHLASGRFFNVDEDKSQRKVVILGSTVKSELFGDSSALGKRVRIKKRMFEVIGVMEERGTVAFQDYDDQVFIPAKTMQNLILGIRHFGIIRAKIDSENNVPEAISDIKKTLREQHGIFESSGVYDDFTVRSSNQAIEMISIITNSLKFFLAAMAALSLLVGGIGIMNIMLVSVTERKKEIGLRKAIGARKKDILTQFLIEAVTVSMLGGVSGILLGIAFSFVVALGVMSFGYSWDFIISPWAVLSAVSVSSLVGIFFGIYPALKAARLDPIIALRHD